MPALSPFRPFLNCRVVMANDLFSAFGGLRNKTRIDGLRQGDPTLALQRFMPAKSEPNHSIAPSLSRIAVPGCGPSMRGGLRP